MKNNIFKNLKIASIILCGSLFLFSCESDPDDLGEQFVKGNAIQGNESQYDVVAYNINNNDTIRSDDYNLSFAQLGAFRENVFGMQKASYVSQVRMQTYNPDFGQNAVLDSVVLVLNPLYATDSATAKTNEDYVYPEGNVPSKLETSTYPVLKYGRAKLNGSTTKFNIKIHEVNDFLESNSKKVYSNANINYSQLLGQYEFDGNIKSAKITRDDNSQTLFTSTPSLRIPLDKSFFKTKLIDAQGSNDLKDAASFIRYFKGIRIAVDENDGYMFTINPNNAQIIMYYKYDKVTNGSTTKTPKTFTLNLGNPNVHISLIENDRAGSTVSNALSSINTTTGDYKIYAQGLGGPSIGVELPSAVVSEIKQKVKNEKIGIVNAKIRMYTDVSTWNNNYIKPNSFVFNNKDATDFIKEISKLSNAPNFKLVRAYDTDKALSYYEFTITQTLKDIVENDVANMPLRIDVGDYITNNQGTRLGYDRTSRVFNPARVAFVGSDPENDKRIKLIINYGSK